MSDKPVLFEVRDAVARLRLNRPAAANALNGDLLGALVQATEAIASDAGVRVVLLSGEGPHFCAGGDVKEFAAQGERLPEHLGELTRLLAQAARNLMELPAPVIALVQGAATGGGGLGLVCAADIVLAGPEARFMLGATRVGMAPDAGLSVTLPRLVGLRQALRLALLNPMLNAREAQAIGLVTEVTQSLSARGEELAATLAAGPAEAQAQTKRLIRQGSGAPLAEALADESATVSELSGNADSREGLAAVIERRSPRFS